MYFYLNTDACLCQYSSAETPHMKVKGDDPDFYIMMHNCMCQLIYGYKWCALCYIVVYILKTYKVYEPYEATLVQLFILVSFSVPHGFNYKEITNCDLREPKKLHAHVVLSYCHNVITIKILVFKRTNQGPSCSPPM